MLSKDEAMRLQQVCRKLAHQVELTLHQTGESDFGRKLEDFIGEVCALSQGKIRFTAESTDSHSSITPCFKIGSEGRTGITYAAIPLGHQFLPFTKAVEQIGGDGFRAQNSNPAASDSKLELQVLISSECPRCPVVAEEVIRLAGRHPQISLSIVDAEQFSDLTQQYGVKSVPATILDRRLVLIGSVSADRLMELIESRGTPKFETEVVQSLIETGRIPEAARCLNQDAGREVILTLMQNLDFSKRLSGLVVVEKALEDNPGSVRTLVPSLINMLSHEDSRIRGDIADLLGKIGDPQAISHLEPLASDPDPDVAEAAAEAIEELRKLQ
jgi:alkyl hydroperoxide reductase subunit F